MANTTETSAGRNPDGAFHHETSGLILVSPHGGHIGTRLPTQPRRTAALGLALGIGAVLLTGGLLMRR